MTTHASTLPPLDTSRVATIEKFGAKITPLDPVGAEVEGIDLSSEEGPPVEVVEALEREMAERGFLVFRNDQQLEVDDFLRVSRWWGGKELHSTHGVHPATPGGNPHIFRLSNDRRHGIRLRQDDGERPGPEAVHERSCGSGNAGGEAISLLQRRYVHDKGVVGRPPFGRKYLLHGIRAKGVSAKPVHRLCRKGTQLPRLDVPGRFFGRGGEDSGHVDPSWVS